MPCIFGTNKPQTVKFNIFGSQTSKRWWCCLLPWYKLILSKSNITGTDGGATPLMRSWYSFSLLSKQVMLYLVHKKDVVNKIKINVFFSCYLQLYCFAMHPGYFPSLSIFLLIGGDITMPILGEYEIYLGIWRLC